MRPTSKAAPKVRPRDSGVPSGGRQHPSYGSDDGSNADHAPQPRVLGLAGSAEIRDWTRLVLFSLLCAVVNVFYQNYHMCLLNNFLYTIRSFIYRCHGLAPLLHSLSLYLHLTPSSFDGLQGLT